MFTIQPLKRKKMQIFYCLQQLRLHLLIYVILTFLTTSALCFELPCDQKFWWDTVTDSCLECTLCNDQMVVLRPCQTHQDTICGTINDLEFDWSWLTRTEKYNQNWKERRKETELAYSDQDDVLLDWQAACLGLVAVFCLLFVIAVIYLSLHQIKQLKQIERLNKDYKALCATLSEVQNLENGTIIFEEVYNDKQHVNNINNNNNNNPIEVQCIYLEQLLAGKEKSDFSGTGNIYIEESSVTSKA